MDSIKIYHAFNGFLYAPVFLANEMGFFPKNAELIYTEGDDKAIEGLCSESDDGTQSNGFAICDPFSVDLNTAMEHTRDEICVVGSLINVLPIWVFSSGAEINPVGKESELAKYSQNIDKIRSYPKGTTGYLIAKRIQKILNLQDKAFEEKKFGEEFDGNVPESAVVVTSDILRIVHEGLSNKNIVFNYPNKSPSDLEPFLFTAILTLKDRTVHTNLWAVLSVLGAIRYAIDCLNERNVDEKFLQALVGIYGKEEFGNVFKKLNITDDAEKRKLIRNAVSYSVRTTKLYSDYPKPKDQEQWSTAWNNAKSVWEGQNSRHKDDEVTIERKDEPIPALLVKRQWKPGLREYFEMLFGQKKQGEAPTCSKKGFLKRSEHAAISLGAFLSLAGFLAVYLASYYVFSDKAKVITGISWWFGLLIILWVAQTTLYLAIRKRIMDLAGYETALSSFWLGITLTFWGAAIAQVLSNL